MADPTDPGARSAPPPPPPPPPGEPYSAPRGPVPESLQNDSYFGSPTPSPWTETPTEAPAKQPMQLGWVVALLVGLASAVGGYFLVQKVFFDAGAPSPEEVAAAFVPVAGTTYQEPPAGSREQFRSLLDQQGDALEQIETFDMRLLLVGAQPVGAVVIFSVDPDVLAEEDFEREYLQGFNLASGQELVPTNIGGVDAFEGQIPGIGSMYTFFDDDGLIFFIGGQQKALMEQTVTTLGTANS